MIFRFYPLGFRSKESSSVIVSDGARLMCDASVWEESWETKVENGSLVFVKMEGGVGEDETMTSGARSPVFQDSAAVWNTCSTTSSAALSPSSGRGSITGTDWI